MSALSFPSLPAGALPLEPADAALLACFGASPVGFGLFDPEERLQRANAVFLEAFDAQLDGAPTWEALMRSCHQRRRGLLINTPDIESWLAKVRTSHRQVPVRTFESDLVDGRWMWVNETVRPDGWLLVVMIDITPLKAHEATLRNARDQAVLASLTDPLTGLYNRRFIFDRLDDLLASARSMRIALSVVMIDLDHFKQINDRHGHGVGDGVLQHFATQLRRHLRPLDAAGRIGGEEFMLVLPNTMQAGAELAVVRLRQLVRSGAQLAQGPPVAYSFSAGFAEAQPGESAAALVKRADLAMYRAKSQGRDCQVAADSAPATPY